MTGVSGIFLYIDLLPGIANFSLNMLGSKNLLPEIKSLTFKSAFCTHRRYLNER